MFTSEIISDERPPLWRTVLLSALCIFMSGGSWVFSPSGYVNETTGAMAPQWVAACFWAMLAPPLLLRVRHKHPFAITIAAAVVPLLLPVGPWLFYVAMTSLIARRHGRAVALTEVLGFLTSGYVLLADALSSPIGASFQKYLFSPQGMAKGADYELSLGSPLALMAICMALVVASGLLKRSKVEARAAKDEATNVRATTESLGDEVARRQERERIAREVHDAMGHRLSLLNLHAGAMEANAVDDPKLRDSASLVRQSAGEAMDDLRSLLSVLREPLGSDPPDIPLSDLQKVVQDSFGAGQQIVSSIFIEDARMAHPSLSRAVYRIVQELLTNARKHAPHEQVQLSVTGGPLTGVVIDAQNRYVGAASQATPGQSRGLAGIAERVELLGGALQYGLDDGGRTFRVYVTLPWLEFGQDATAR